MNIPSMVSLGLAATVIFLASACQQNTPAETMQTPVVDSVAVEPASTGLKIAFIYGDTINAGYKFLLDVEAELEKEGKLIDERIRRKLQRAEQRAGELQKEAQYMTQTQMQEAQIEMQNLEIELQQFEQKLAADFRKREIELQREYVDKVDAFLEEFNADGTYDIIMNFQKGGNLLWMKEKFDVTAEVLEGLNAAYDAEMAAQAEETEAE